MSPNLEDHEKPQSPTDDIVDEINRLDLVSPSSSEATTSSAEAVNSVYGTSTSSSDAESNHTTPYRTRRESQRVNLSRDVDIPEELIVNYIPLEHNLRELLLKVTDTDELETVTQIKLRVIAREVSLQHLGVYMPSLRELVLDGSIISSLRDLGSSLKNLKILRVNNCQLNCVDGVFGFENLEELYIADNEINDISPCAFISCLKVLDIRRNGIKHITGLSFIGLCQDLEHLYVSGNDGITQFPQYRLAIKMLLPGLKSLDGDEFTLDEMMTAVVNGEEYFNQNYSELYEEDTTPRTEESFTSGRSTRSVLARNRSTPSNASEGFTVSFPPRLLSTSRTHSENPR